MKTKRLTVSPAVQNLVIEGLLHMGSQMLNSVEIGKLLHKRPRFDTLTKAREIRETLAALGRDRAWALQWIKLGVKVERDLCERMRRAA